MQGEPCGIWGFMDLYLRIIKNVSVAKGRYVLSNWDRRVLNKTNKQKNPAFSIRYLFYLNTLSFLFCRALQFVLLASKMNPVKSWTVQRHALGSGAVQSVGSFRWVGYIIFIIKIFFNLTELLDEARTVQKKKGPHNRGSVELNRHEVGENKQKCVCFGGRIFFWWFHVGIVKVHSKPQITEDRAV